MRACRSVLFACVLLTSCGVVSVSEAQSVDFRRPHRGARPLQLDLHGGFTWWGYGAAAGGRFGIPIIDNGFISSVNNAVYLNFGADLYVVRYRRSRNSRDPYEYHPGFGAPISLHWEFYFNDTWSAFVEVGANVYFHPGFLRGHRDFFEHDYVGAWFLGAVGGRLHLNRNVALTLRVGVPYTSFGVTFLI